MHEFASQQTKNGCSKRRDSLSFFPSIGKNPASKFSGKPLLKAGCAAKDRHFCHMGQLTSVT
jgi:hypothetical protein